MKLLGVYALVAGSLVSAYTHQIWNNTPGTIKVQAYLVAGPTKEIILPPGTKGLIDAVGWATYKFVTYGMDNQVRDLYAEANVPGLQLRGVEVYVTYEGPEQYLPPRPSGMTETDYLNVYLTPELRTRIANIKRKLSVEVR